MKTLILSFAVLLGTVSCTSLNSSMAPDGTNYSFGTLSSYIDSPLENTDVAVSRALRHLKLRESSHKADAFLARIRALNALDKEIVINLVKVTAQTTRVEIKVGYLGDEALSHAILEEIKRN